MTRSQRTSRFDFRATDLSAEGLERTSALLRAVFPAAKHLTPSYLDWQYNRNPAGPAIAHDAWLGDALVGHYATLPGPLRLFGQSGVGAHILNLAVLAEHQGHGLMKELARRTFARGRELGVACVWGVANVYSTRAHGPLGFQVVRALEARIGVGPLPRARAAEEPEFARHWDEEALRWRLANPSVHYDLVSVGGRCEIQADSGVARIRAVLGTTDAPLGAPRRGSGLRPRLWLGVDPALRWRGRAYVDLPARLRPAPLNLMFKHLEGARELDPARVRIHGIDFDAY